VCESGNQINTALTLIDWCWKTMPGRLSIRGEICQCQTEDVIRRSPNASRMRSFLMIGVLIDQMMFSHFSQVYDEFHNQFRFPKLQAHPVPGMASPSWLIYSRRHFDENMDWQETAKVVDILFLDVFDWLQGRVNIKDFISLLKDEVEREFESVHQEKLEQYVLGRLFAYKPATN